MRKERDFKIGKANCMAALVRTHKKYTPTEPTNIEIDRNLLF